MDIQKNVITKSVFLELFNKIVDPQYMEMVKNRDISGIYTHKKDISSQIKKGLTASIIINLLKIRIKPIFKIYFNKYTNEIEDIICPKIVGKISFMVKNAIGLALSRFGPLKVPLQAFLFKPGNNPIDTAVDRVCKELIKMVIKR